MCYIYNNLADMHHPLGLVLTWQLCFQWSCVCAASLFYILLFVTEIWQLCNLQHYDKKEWSGYIDDRLLHGMWVTLLFITLYIWFGLDPGAWVSISGLPNLSQHFGFWLPQLCCITLLCTSSSSFAFLSLTELHEVGLSLCLLLIFFTFHILAFCTARDI